jgi:hypothetical protein
MYFGESQKINGRANRKYAKCHICGMTANITNYLSLPFPDLRFA